MNRAWSTFVLKSVDEEQRVLTGIASTPNTDRMSDVVEPLGAKFKLPLPLLWQHDAQNPVGHVTHATLTRDGIPVTIKMASYDQPGALKDRLDDAWGQIKLKLVRGLSIGFAPDEYSLIEATGGVHFTSWTWLELSAVTIPANADASITSIKRFDLGVARTTGVRLPFLKPEVPDVVLPKSWSGITPSGFMGKIAMKLLPAIGDVIVESLMPLRDRIRVLELVKTQYEIVARDGEEKIQSLVDRIDRLESSLAEHKYQGVWEPGAYREHNTVTYRGSLWIALCDTVETPGTCHDWQLAAKKGRDAR